MHYNQNLMHNLLVGLCTFATFAFATFATFALKANVSKSLYHSATNAGTPSINGDHATYTWFLQSVHIPLVPSTQRSVLVLKLCLSFRSYFQSL